MKRRLTRTVMCLAWTLMACRDAPDPAVLSAPNFTAGGVGRAAVLVNPNSDENGTARTIQEGIHMVADGGTVAVMPGTYEERIVIDRGLTLRGLANGSGLVVIRQSPEISAPAAEAVILVETTHSVIIRDLTVHHDNIRGLNALRNVDLVVERASFEGVATTAVIVNNGVTVVNHAGTSGGRARAVVRDSRFTVGGIGVAIGGDVDARIERNHIRSSGTRVLCLNVSPTGQGGTALPTPGTETNVDIVDNLIEDCGANIAGRFNSVLIAGTPEATTEGAVNLTGNTFRNLSATQCPASAIAYEHYSGIIEHNKILDVVKEHCAAANPGRSWPGAIFVGSRLAGIRAATVAVRFNDVVGNAHAGLRIGANQPDALDARCNWWGSADGPSGAGPGSGDAVVVEAGAGVPLFTPFATGPIAGSEAAGCS